MGVLLLVRLLIGLLELLLPELVGVRLAPLLLVRLLAPLLLRLSPLLPGLAPLLLLELRV